MGRYIKPGPIGLTGGLNGYGYAYQNSVVSFDSKELLPFIVILIVWGIIETAMMAYDTYDTVQRLVDLCVSYFYKSITFAAFIAKLGLPGGGYSSGIRIKAS